MKYPDPARCRFPGAVTLEPATCHSPAKLHSSATRQGAAQWATEQGYRYIGHQEPARP